jgi:hypothetical protein
LRGSLEIGIDAGDERPHLIVGADLTAADKSVQIFREAEGGGFAKAVADVGADIDAGPTERRHDGWRSLRRGLRKIGRLG